MADLSEVRIGSKLVLTLEVTHEAAFKGRSHPFGVKGLEGISLAQTAIWLTNEIIAAAEHIPAPRVFKRGDWVSWKDGSVAQMVVRDLGDTVWVTSSDPTKNILWRKQDCELTENPNG